jgi:methyl-accepting chemotaxis protein
MSTGGRTARDGRRGVLRLKIVGLTAGSMALLGAIVGASFAWQARAELRAEVLERTRAVAVALAQAKGFVLFLEDEEMLAAAAQDVLRDTPGAMYVAVRDAGGKVVALEVASGFPKDALPPVESPDAVAQRSIEPAGTPLFDVTVPMRFEEGKAWANAARIGTAQVGVRADGVDARVIRIVTHAALFGLAVFVACVLAAFLLARMLTTPLERLSQAAAEIAAGDLRRSLEIRGKDEIAETGQSFRRMSDGLRSVVADLKSAAAQIDGEARQIAVASAQHAAMASQQAAAIAETTTTVSEIAQTAKRATEHADGVIQIAAKSEDLSQEGQGAVSEAKRAIEQLGDQVKAITTTIAELAQQNEQIAEIIATVKDLAEQSNILALNAAIEASRAGDAGRGFAVVAAEIRTLAEASRSAAAEVRAILGHVQQRTRAAVDASQEGARRAQAAVTLAQSAGDSIVGLADAIRESSSAARQIATSTREQTTGVEHIVAAINDLSGAMNESVAGTKQIQEVTESLTAMSARLTELVARYEV